jgi:hypothetical protein
LFPVSQVVLEKPQAASRSKWYSLFVLAVQRELICGDLSVEKVIKKINPQILHMVIEMVDPTKDCCFDRLVNGA